MARRTTFRGGRELAGSRPLGPLIVTGLVALLGVPLFASGLYGSAATIHFVVRSTRTVGTVVELDPDPDSRSLHHAIVSFAAADGEHHFTSASSDSTSHVGDRVPVRYLSWQPSTAAIADARHLWLGPLFSLGLGTALVGLAAIAAIALSDSLPGPRRAPAGSAAADTLPPGIRERATRDGQTILYAVYASSADIQFDVMWAGGWTVFVAIAAAIAMLVYSDGAGPWTKLAAPLAALTAIVAMWIVSLVTLVRSLVARTWTVLTSSGVLQSSGVGQRFIRWDQFDPDRSIQSGAQGAANAISLPLRTAGWSGSDGEVGGTPEDVVISGAADAERILHICRARIKDAVRHTRLQPPMAAETGGALQVELDGLPARVTNLARSEHAEFVVRARRRVPLKQTAVAMALALVFTAVGAPLVYLSFTTPDPHWLALRIGTVLFTSVGVMGVIGNTIDLVRWGPYYVGTPASLIAIRGKTVDRRPWGAFAGDIAVQTDRRGGTVTLTLRTAPPIRVSLIGVPDADRIERLCRRRIDEATSRQ